MRESKHRSGNGDAIIVRTTQDLRDALAAGVKSDRIEVHSENIPLLIKKAREEGHAAGRAERIESLAGQVNPEIQEILRAQERERISAIQAVTEPGLENIAREAIANGLSAQEFAYRQAMEIRDRGITLSQISADAPPSAPHASPGLYEPSLKRAIDAESVYARRRQSPPSR